MTMIKLSICIATYNRADYIGETLDSIIPQMTNEVELVIVDGASTDNTQNILQRYAAVYPSLKYVRLSAKGGVDQDFCKAVEHAQGEYCWLFPDDDLFLPGAINRILKEIENDYNLIIVNARVMDKDLLNILMPSKLENSNDAVYKPSEIDNLFEHIISCISYIGVVVIKRELWMQCEKEQYYGTEFIHVGVIFQDYLSGDAKVIGEPYITIRYGNAQWSSRSFEIWMVKWPRLILSFNCISDALKKRKVQIDPWRNIKNIISLRALGEYNYKIFRRIIQLGKVSVQYRIICFIISFFPILFLNRIMFFYLKYIRQAPQIAIYNFTLKK